MRDYLPNKQFLKTFFKYALPVIIQALVLFSIGLVDTLLVSGLRNEAVSATYAVNQLTFVFNILAQAVVMGASIYVQQFYGAKDGKRVSEAHRAKLVINFITIAVSLLLVFVFGEQLISFFARNDLNKPGIMDDASKYAPLIFISYIPLGFVLTYGSTFREIRKTHYPLIATSIALVFQTGLGYILIYPANMGILGAAVATIIARTVELIIVLILAERVKLINLKTTFRHFVINKTLFAQIIKAGIPMFLNHMAWGIGMVVLSMSYAERANVLSAFNVFGTITNFFQVLYSSLAVGVVVMIGNVLGEGEIEEAKVNGKRLLFFGMAAGLVFGLILMSLSGVIPHAFEKVDPLQKQLATQLLLVYGAFLPFFVIPSVAFGALRTGGKAKYVVIVDVISMWLYAVPIAWILITQTNLDVIYIYLIVQLGDLVKGIIGIVLMLKVNWAVNLAEEFEQVIVET